MFEETNDLDTSTTVSPDTDDLDQFSLLLEGKAAEKQEEVEEVEQTQEIDEDSVATETEETEEDSADEDDSEKDEASEEKPKKVNRFQERINDLLAKERKTREEADAREALLLKKIEELSQPKQVETAKTSSAAAGPSPDDLGEDGEPKYPLGEFDPGYIRDLTRHTIQTEREQAKAEALKEQALAQEQEARQVVQQKWDSNLAPVVEQYDDFLEKTLELETTFDGLDAGYSDYLVQTIKALDHGPEVLYYFANNLEEAQKFVKMGPQAATLALGEYNALFKKQSRKEATKVSTAPTPPPQVNKGSKTRTSIAGDTDDLDAFSDMLFKKGRT